MITLEECLQLTSEATCFSYVDRFRDGCTSSLFCLCSGTILRNYPRCRGMHFWRGFIEFVALLSSAQFLLFQFHDRNTVQLRLLQETDFKQSNKYILRETLARSLAEKERLFHRSDEEQLVV